MGFWLRFRYPQFLFCDSNLLAEYHRVITQVGKLKREQAELQSAIKRLER